MKKNQPIGTISAVYAIVLKYPDDNVLRIKDVASYLWDTNFRIQMIRHGEAGSNEVSVNVCTI